jgi:hypothetical protein
MKRQIKYHYLESQEFLEELIINTYDEVINGTKVYKNWYENYMPKSLIINYNITFFMKNC